MLEPKESDLLERNLEILRAAKRQLIFRVIFATAVGYLFITASITWQKCILILITAFVAMMIWRAEQDYAAAQK